MSPRLVLILEMLLLITFLMLMTYACMDKRIIAEAFYLYEAPYIVGTGVGLGSPLPCAIGTG